MATLLNEQKMNVPTAPDRAAELHNAQISENYRLLKDAVERQIATFDFEEQPRASVMAPERPVEREVETPQYSHERVSSSLFTTDTP